MAVQFKNVLSSIKSKLIIEEERTRFQFIAVFILFSVISLGMTIINIFTHFELLMWSTLIFAICNLINVILAFFGGKLEKISHLIFGVEIMALFTFFLIVGEPEGFSITWSAMLPIGGMLLYRRKYGTIISLCFLTILIFFCWIPYGRSLLQFSYSDSFYLRFPVLYLAFFFIGFFFEMVRAFIQHELTIAKDKYERMSYIDSLTGLGNENSYFKIVDNLEDKIKEGTAEFAIVVLDINNLKVTNDTFGHRYGSHLIVETANRLEKAFPNCPKVHVGGDEFVVFIIGENLAKLDEFYKNYVQTLKFSHTIYDNTELILSVAGSYAIYQKGDTYKDTFAVADKKMYEVKEKIKKEHQLPDR